MQQRYTLYICYANIIEIILIKKKINRDFPINCNKYKNNQLFICIHK